MIDKKIILKHLNELEKCIKQLDRHKNCSAKQLLSDFDLRWAVERGLHLAIQNILDISSHILVDIGANGLDDYTSIIDQMGEMRIIPEGFAKKIRGMAGLRNVLVHDYVDIDAEKLCNYVSTGLDDFKKFAKYIADYLAKKQ